MANGLEQPPYSSAELDSYTCAQKLKINLEPIKACVTGPAGNQAMGAIAKRTRERVGTQLVTQLPWVALNGLHLEEFANVHENLDPVICFAALAQGGELPAA